MDVQKVIRYWKMVLAGIGIACIAAALFAPAILNGIVGACIGILCILSGFVLAIYEEKE